MTIKICFVGQYHRWKPKYITLYAWYECIIKLNRVSPFFSKDWYYSRQDQVMPNYVLRTWKILHEHWIPTNYILPGLNNTAVVHSDAWLTTYADKHTCLLQINSGFKSLAGGHLSHSINLCLNLSILELYKSAICIQVVSYGLSGLGIEISL